MSRNERVRVLLACSGLEHAKRGYESFARECFETLRPDPRLDLELVKSTGASGPHERVVPAITRDGSAARALGRLRASPLKWEQLAFAFSLQAEIARFRPQVIYFSEWYTGIGLARIRRITRQAYALVLSNGSMSPTGFEPFDRVHQHTAPALEHVLALGADPRRQALLPVAFQVGRDIVTVGDQARRSLRERLMIPHDRQVVISVAALNAWHKRLDYLIDEVARLPEPRPYLLLVGQPEPETEALRARAAERLGAAGHSFRTVPRAEVDDLVRASDMFVLASLAEGLPRALVEALALGAPCLAHDYSISHYALEHHGRFADFTRAGALSSLIAAQARVGWRPELAAERRRSVYDRFSWDALYEPYVALLQGAVGRADFVDVPLPPPRAVDSTPAA